MVVGGLLVVIAYQLISVARNLKELSDNLNNASVEAGEKIGEALERLSELPIFSYFFKKRSSEEQSTKGRGKIINKNSKTVNKKNE